MAADDPSNAGLPKKIANLPISLTPWMRRTHPTSNHHWKAISPGSAQLGRGTPKLWTKFPRESPSAADMITRGLVGIVRPVGQGMEAYLDGRRVPILRTNHAFRGVDVPAGKSTIEFRYEPASLTWGLRLSGLALLVSIVWLGVGLRYRSPATPSEPEPELPPAEPSARAGGRKHGDRRSRKRRMN